MDQSNYELLPSVIIDANDPKKLGRIKAQIPNISDATTMALDLLPWINPGSMSGYQQFSKPMKGAKVWIKMNRKNHNELWYLPYNEMNDSTKAFVQANYSKDPEVVFSRANGHDVANITYDSGQGIMLKVNSHRINIQPSGDIDIIGGSGVIKIKGSKVFTGTDEEGYEPMVQGTKLQKILDDLCAAFNTLKTLSANSYGSAATLVEGFNQAIQALDGNKTTEMLCENSSCN